ncbi:MAG: hypothetical protein J5835_07935 [Bacteroidales bacterium]|nr:hypothetical protein [Bacteroidales bacterium]
MKRLFFAIFLLLLAASCTNVDPDIVKGGTQKVAPNENGQISIDLAIKSNLSDFVRVSYTVIGLDGSGRYGQSGKDNSAKVYSREWFPREGTIKVAILAEQTHYFTDVLLAQKITFSASATVKTPTDGCNITWCGIEDSIVENPDVLLDYTVNAINKGLPGQPKGTGREMYVQFKISLAEDGGYSITPEWVKGNIIKN